MKKTLSIMVLVCLVSLLAACSESGKNRGYSTSHSGGVSIEDRTEENVEYWRYDGSQSPDGMDWQFIDRAREAFYTGR